MLTINFVEETSVWPLKWKLWCTEFFSFGTVYNSAQRGGSNLKVSQWNPTVFDVAVQCQGFFVFAELKDHHTVTAIATKTHAAVWIQETPSTILNKRFRILVYRFHDLGPIQTLDAFRVFNVTRTEEYKENENWQLDK